MSDINNININGFDSENFGNSVLFFDFLEGKMSDETEKKFFTELSENDNLRNEYKCFNVINSKLEGSLDCFKPTDILKNKIYAKAGIILPTAYIDTENNERDNKDSKSLKKQQKNKRWLETLFTAVGSSLITILILGMFKADF